MSLSRATFSAYALSRLAIYILLCQLIPLKIALADWNSGVTIEDVATRIAINVEDTGVKVTVDLSPDAMSTLKSTIIKGKNLTLNTFALKTMGIQSEQVLTSTIQPTPADLEANTSTTLIFAFAKGRQPESLKITPDFEWIKKAGEHFLINVSHQGLPVIDHAILTQAEILNLNWQDPWYSQFANPDLKRDHNDPVMAFLYLEPRQIKSEVVVRVKEMATWTDLGLRDSTMIHPDEFDLLKQKIADFLLAHDNISIDNQQLSPVLNRVDYIRMGAADIQAYTPQKAQKQVATLIGVSITHQVKSLPPKVDWQWGLFNQKIQRVAIRAYDPAGLFDSYVTPEYPVFEWENMLADIDLPALSGTPKTKKIAVSQADKSEFYCWIAGLASFFILSSLLCLLVSPKLKKYAWLTVFIITSIATYKLYEEGKLSFNGADAHLKNDEATVIMKQLLWNIYQAFESTQEDAAYDQLADSVSGELQETLYLQNRQSFLAQDGAWSKVKEIKIQQLNSQSSSNDGHLFDCTWLVVGEVIHWGHQHRRENLYQATIKLSPIDDHWKIVHLESTGQQRI